jgi:transcription antitermination factor NusG
MITEGPYAGIRAVVTKSEGRKRISVGLELLGRGVMATVPAGNVVRVPDELELHDVIAGMEHNNA